MAGKINIGDTWKNTADIKINIGDTWKAVTGGYINIGDTWKKWWPDEIQIPVNDGKYMYLMKSDGNIIKSIDSGTNWTNPSRTGTAYGDISCNSTGQYVITTSDDYNGCYVSSNYGVSFSSKAIAGGHYQTACSTDGSKMYVSGSNNYTFYSHNYGVTWNSVRMQLGLSPTFGTACNGDGSIVYHTGELGIYKSVTSGTTFSLISGSTNMRQCACSITGQYIISARNPGLVYISADYGSTWSSKLYSAGWYSVAMSLDGKTQMVGAENGNIFCYSTDFGSSWLTGGTQQTYGLDCSGHGQKILSGGWGNYSKLSLNNGLSWTNTYNSGNYFGVAVNKIQ